MIWCEHLTRRPKAPAWKGPAQVHNLLSAGDEPEDDDTPPPQQDERFCTGPCEKAYPATTDYFYVLNMRGRIGLHPKCKECMKADERERAARKKREGA